MFCNLKYFEMKKKLQDTEGRFIILDVVVSETVLTFINIYAPNSDDRLFFWKRY